jgi:two-component system, sensor histidine kinase and response regulator
MDLQMPEMDGHETTISLRADPRFASLSIIAMTAHAQEEERARCLAEGMNDHIAKPIDPLLFYKLLSHYLGNKLSGYNEATTNNVPLSLTFSGLDSQNALQRLNGNQKLYLQLLQQYCKEQCVSIRQVRQLLTERELTAVQPLIHSLKGVSANIGATTIAAQAAQLEKAIGQQKAHAELLLLLGQLDETLHHLCHQINAATVIEHKETSAVTPVTDDQLAALITLIENNDCSALDQYAELEPGLQLRIPAFELHQINSHLQAFDFDLALARLARFTITTVNPDAQSPD